MLKSVFRLPDGNQHRQPEKHRQPETLFSIAKPKATLPYLFQAATTAIAQKISNLKIPPFFNPLPHLSTSYKHI
ncbi:hypothetical protein [Kingella sp. (in: b-proteobacteria)]|uniref:hypothetical protein n=1 Tax=Kingella sp. (in: b-proteobacteria) TaxID=2020713 RepID=UPI0026DCA79C|nr:hypothetical protein [Kingella sp. (in: b-proteobacteria)]MDO4657039.1 hypothetical protein [Kingella sp. (in: b-proteobacteria)]